MVQTLWEKGLAVTHTTKQSQDPAIVFLGIYSRKIKTHVSTRRKKKLALECSQQLYSRPMGAHQQDCGSTSSTEYYPVVERNKAGCIQLSELTQAIQGPTQFPTIPKQSEQKAKEVTTHKSPTHTNKNMTSMMDKRRQTRSRTSWKTPHASS